VQSLAEAPVTGPGNYRRQPYAGFDDGTDLAPPSPPPSPHDRALADARNEIQMQAHRIKQLESALRSAAHVLTPFLRPTKG
jgi:hypothetical protein